MNIKQNILKLIILTIVLVLSCLRGYAQMIPSTGNRIQTDTNLVSIPIEYIRIANQKLIERNYLIDVNNYKDSIIVDYKNYIVEYEKVNIKFQEQLDDYKRINEDLAKSLNKQKKTSLVFGSIAGASILTIVLIALVN